MSRYTKQRSGCRLAQELDEEAHGTQRFDLMGNLGLDDTRFARYEYMLLGLSFEDSVAKPPFEHDDASPYARLGGVASS